MKLVVQRVNRASVLVKGKTVGKIGKGYLVLLGVKKGDGEKEADYLSERLAKLRVMADKNDKMNLSLKDIDGEVLVVSQFTLHADTKKGNRPSFMNAGEPKRAEELYEYFIDSLKNQEIKVETGKFGAMMRIDAELDGPVTILLSQEI